MASAPHRVPNFGAGPGALPLSVLQQMASEMLDFRGTGMSIGELSHRSQTFVDVVTEAERDLRALLNVPTSHRVLFMSGGGTGQFAAVPLNLLSHLPPRSCSYVVSGSWSKAAAAEASKFCVCETFDDVTGAALPATPLVYACTNETVNGVLFDPVDRLAPGQILIADMSSEILTRRIDVSRYGLIFAGAQKNVGIAGVTVVIVRADLLGHAAATCPIVLDYTVTDKNGSLYNTPPTMAIYVAGLVFKWALAQGGVAALETATRRKAALVYEALERHPQVFRVLVQPPLRSQTNVVFRCVAGEALDKRFVAEAERLGMVGLAGHRSVGGMRVSLYNAVELNDVVKLVAFIDAFAAGQQ